MDSNRFQNGPKFTEAMYRKVGLKTDTGSPGQARQRPANLNETVTYRVTDDHHDIGVQKRLAGLTEDALVIPNPGGVVRLRPEDGKHGILDLDSTLEAIGLRRDMGRLYESRTASEQRADTKRARLEKLQARKEALQEELRAVDLEIQRQSRGQSRSRLVSHGSRLVEDGSKLENGVMVAKTSGGYVLIRERADGSWVGLGKTKLRYTGSRDKVLAEMTKDAAEKFKTVKSAASAFDRYYKFSRDFMGKKVAA